MRRLCRSVKQQRRGSQILEFWELWQWGAALRGCTVSGVSCIMELYVLCVLCVLNCSTELLACMMYAVLHSILYSIGRSGFRNNYN